MICCVNELTFLAADVDSILDLCRNNVSGFCTHFNVVKTMLRVFFTHFNVVRTMLGVFCTDFNVVRTMLTVFCTDFDIVKTMLRVCNRNGVSQKGIKKADIPF